MRKPALTLAAATLLSLALAGPAAASAAPPIPDLTDCHEVNKLLHIDNVRDCDGS